MSNESESPELVDEAEPTSSRMPAAEPAPEPAPVERPAPEAAPVELGTPVGQLVVGGLLVAAVLTWVLYRVGGWPWALIGLGGLLGVGLLVLLAPMLWRRWRSGNGRSGGGNSSRRGGGGAGRPWSLGRSPRPSTRARNRDGGHSPLSQMFKRRRSPKSPGAAGDPADKRSRFRFRKKAPDGVTRSPAGGPGARPRGPVRRAWAATRAATNRAVAATRRTAAALRRGDRRLTTAAQAATQRLAGVVKARTQRLRQRGAAWLRQVLTRARAWDERLTGGLAAAVWARWRPRRAPTAAAATAEQAAATPEQPSPETSRPAPFTIHGSAGPITGGKTMSDFALITHATELPTIAATYESDDMMDVRGHMQMLRELPLAAGTCVRIWTERLAADYPLNTDAAEALQRVYDAFGAAVEACDEAQVVFEGSHEADIQRRLAPRTNEQKWNQH